VSFDKTTTNLAQKPSFTGEGLQFE
jgi:hypothetical protein